MFQRNYPYRKKKYKDSGIMLLPRNAGKGLPDYKGDITQETKLSVFAAIRTSNPM
jgi:hypothetical protein